MDRVLVIRALSLYLPTSIAAIVWAWRPPSARARAGILLATLWAACSLYLLQLLNLHFDWWSFHASGGIFAGMPVDLLLGWSILWSAMPALLLPRLHLTWLWLLAFALDVIVMHSAGR